MLEQKYERNDEITMDEKKPGEAIHLHQTNILRNYIQTVEESAVKMELFLKNSRHG
jgi:hypothetical protein